MALLAPAGSSATAAAGSPAPAGDGRLRHVPALDGLRGLAVVGVLAFHVGWIDGGYLGVDAFFVLSGFLITSLLLGDHRHTDGTRAGTTPHRVRALARFWGRRARRLLPAMLAAVTVVLVWAMVADRDQLGAIRGDAIATVLYVANWHEIATTSSYWAIFDAPSPLQHTWSLAIEEQFYLLWPLVVLGVAVLARRAGRGLAAVLGVVALVLAAASYVLMAALFDDADASRAYFGTGSRLGAIALGAALAALLGPRLLSTTASRADRRLDLLALGCLAFLGWAWLTVDGTSAWLYRGGFSVLGLAVVAVIAAGCRPGGIVATALAWRPLRALGLVSYGLYLWHWVVIAILTEGRTGLDGLPLDLVQIAVSMAAALVSYYALEQPIRTRRWLPRPAPATAMALGASGAVLALAWATVLVPGDDLDALGQRLATATTATTATTVTTGASTGGTTGLATTTPDDQTTVAATPAGPTTATQPPTTVAPAPTTVALPPPRIGVFGDSTAVRTGAGLSAFGARTGAFEVTVNDARVGCGVDQGGERRFLGETFELAEFCGDLVAAWAAALAAHPLDVAVIQTGMWETVDRRLPGDTEWRAPGDPLMDAHLRAELRAANAFWAAQGVPVVWLRGPVPIDEARRPETVVRFNELLSEVVAEYPSARLVALDDFVASLAPADQAQLRPDGTHFTEATAAVVADSWLGAEVLAAADELRRAGSGSGGGAGG